MQPRSETLADNLVGGQQVSAKVAWQEENAYDDAPEKIANNNLQKPPVAGIGETWHADDGKSAGFCRHNRERDGPPGNPLVREKIGSQRAVAIPEAEAKDRYRPKVQGDEQQIGCT